MTFEHIKHIAFEIAKEAYEIQISKKEISTEQRVEISLNLLNAISNLSLNSQEQQRLLFDEAEKQLNIHIMRPSFYSPIPTKTDLLKYKDEWENENIDWNDSKELDLLKNLKQYVNEYQELVENKKFDPLNKAIRYHDAVVYYCMIRHFKPNKIIEVGAGFTTKLANFAAQKNGNTTITCIDPFPKSFLEKDFSQILIKKPVQEIPFEIFDELSQNDFLFIDSSHISKIYSDVNHLFFKIFPRLKNNVIIHIHDIFLPKSWSHEWIEKIHNFWNEQYLLHAFLMNNDSFKILLGVHYLQTFHPQELIDFHKIENIGGGSFWMQKIK